jgi:hypothetical protein
MPAIDEDILRDLLHRSTDDLHAPAAVTAGIITRDRRRRRRAATLSVATAGVAAGTAAGLVAAGGGAARVPASGAARPATAVRLTAAQHVLYRLSSAAAAAPQSAGRYAVLIEKQDTYEKTSVIDGRTGDIWTYQHGAGVPSELPVDRHGSPTQAAFAALPTAPAALRAVLIAQARQEQAQAQAQQSKVLREKLAAVRHSRRYKAIPEAGSMPAPTANDEVFGQATDLLWNPLVGPALRSALLRVLAATPGVVVNAHARDSIGRPAIEISRVDSADKDTIAVFEDPATGRVLESTDTFPADKADGFVGATYSDLYLSVTRTAARPTTNPYRG